ncbi:endopeptidase La [Buchnera aphidicola]|uniref:endopeptidase La n=1 Tax=Buchnera aphidicola TaxID=9 RepID=UPI003464CC0F
MDSKCSKYIKIPILPLRDIVIYPDTIIPLFVGRKKSIQCIHEAMQKNKKILLITQKIPKIEEPTREELFSIGTISNILEIFTLPDNTLKILVKGIQRGKIHSLYNKNDAVFANIEKINSYQTNNKELQVFRKIAIEKFKKYLTYSTTNSKKILLFLKDVVNDSQLSNIIASYISLQIDEKQKILEMLNVNERLEYLIITMNTEIDLFKIEKNIKYRIQKNIEKTQREYYLNEQIKEIQKELGKEDLVDECEILLDKIQNLKIPKIVKKKFLSELQKLKMMPAISAEATVVRGYLDWIIKIPWYKKSKLKKDIKKAENILNKEHFGLKKIKDRILEYLSVQFRTNKNNGPILCLVGPPGVGKTSLGKSIAKSIGRKYTKIALGGLKDESEIRGHRRTYIGALPGKIIQNIVSTGVNNPLFLLDEIDKITNDIHTDPTSALLEVLDPEQNTNFHDHYLELDYDLSKVIFVVTANTTNIPTPLLDRMEIIYISSYTEEEKFHIATQHLIPKQIQKHGLKTNEIKICNKTVKNIIYHYTKEAGVRNVEREIAKICRKVVRNLLTKKSIKHISIKNSNLKEYLGEKKFNYEKIHKKNVIGEVTGLAWTEYGGELLTIETACIIGQGKLSYTGHLGKVMQESIQTAFTVVKKQSIKLGIKTDFYNKYDIHVHIPEGAIPKDGPSAGIAICTAIISTITKNPIRKNLAMTGEITLNGNVISIGGLKEKILAAYRGKIKNIIIPYHNKFYLDKIPKKILSNLIIYPIKTIEEVLKISLKNPPFII